MSENSGSPANGATTEHSKSTTSDDTLPGRDLTEKHAKDLTDAAIVLDRINGHARSVIEAQELPDDADPWWSQKLPAKLYFWSQNGRTVPQLAPDDRSNGAKYLFPDGSEPPLDCLRDDGGHGPVLIVEGTKQHLAAYCHAPEEYAIYGMFGCWGWSGRDLTFAKGRLVYVNLDADLATNRDVWNAAQALRDYLMGTIKAAGIKFVITPGAGSTGLDDWLATLPEHERGQALAQLLVNAEPGLPKAPATRKKKKKKKKKKKNPRFFSDTGGLLAYDVAKALYDANHMALTVEGQIAIYAKGVYRTNSLALITLMAVTMRNDYRRDYLNTVGDVLSGILQSTGRVLPERLDQPWINCLNGLVDLETGERFDHDPRWMSSVQFPVEYDPAATCPTFDAWAKKIIGDQLPALLEATSVMLDPTAIPQKALFLFGPARSGKSTYLRLLERIVGYENRSGVSLHELSEDQFAAANLYGKALNVSADLSARHLQDITRFKMMTGEDVVRGNRKYGKDFFFRNTALFAFSANEIPTVGESSRAYVERMQPFEFAHSFAGRVDRSIEPAMLQELPGILNHLIRAWQARKARGHDLDADPAVRQKFEQASDRVALWMAEEMQVVREVNGERVTYGRTLDPELGHTGKWLYHLFSEWALDSGGGRMGKGKFLQRLQTVPGVVDVRLGGHGSAVRGFNVIERTPAEPAEPADSGETSKQHEPESEKDHQQESEKTAGSAGSAGTPPANHLCPRCGGVTMVGKGGRRFCAAPGSCRWKEPEVVEFEDSDGLFEGARA